MCKLQQEQEWLSASRSQLRPSSSATNCTESDEPFAWPMQTLIVPHAFCEVEAGPFIGRNQHRFRRRRPQLEMAYSRFGGVCIFSVFKAASFKSTTPRGRKICQCQKN